MKPGSMQGAQFHAATNALRRREMAAVFVDQFGRDEQPSLYDQLSGGQSRTDFNYQMDDEYGVQ